MIDPVPDEAPVRLDQALVNRGLAQSRSRARALIDAKLVLIDGVVADKPARPIGTDAVLTLAGLDHPWVSRGGIKLAHALDHFEIDPTGWVGLDIGASTGGFTDVLRTRGAAKIYAVDVGHDQLAPALRADPRIVVLEHLNARHLTASHVPERVDIVTCDASFIGLHLVLPAALGRAAPGAVLVALIKPQFEVGSGHVGKGGIVRDPTLHQACCTRVRDWLTTKVGWTVAGVIDSPILGPDGNKEFLICARSAR